MSRQQWIELEELAAKHSAEILRAIPYMTEGEARGNLEYLRRIDAENWS